jgi:type I restriction enzyme M protein
VSLRSAWEQWQADGRVFWRHRDALMESLDRLTTEEKQP